MRRSPNSATKTATLAYCTCREWGFGGIFVVSAKIFHRRDAEGAEVLGEDTGSFDCAVPFASLLARLRSG